MFKINNKDTRITSIDVTLLFFSHVSNTFNAKLSILNYCIFLIFLTLISTRVSLDISCYPGDEIANWLR